MFYDDIDLKFFYVDRKNHDEICKQYGLNFEESYMLFTELWGFAGYWIYDEESFLKKLDFYRRTNNPIETFPISDSFDPDPDPWGTLDRLMESFANDYLKERVYDRDGVRIEYESEPFRLRQADHLESQGLGSEVSQGDRGGDERFKRTYRTHTGQRRGKNDFLNRWTEGREA